MRHVLAADVDRLRTAVLDAWRASPTRLVEDARAEADLAAVGYRDRLFVELAANAADAAAAAGVAGKLAVWRDDEGALHLANTGEPLTAAGVESLLALRVSPKDAAAETVGRFGVGFAAVVPVARRVEVRSRTGTVVFDRTETAREIESWAGLPDGLDAPLLRLAWAGDAAPAEGFDTEIVVLPRTGVDVDALLAEMAAQARDRLLELPALAEITVGEATVTAGEAAAEWFEVATGDIRWLAPIAKRPAAPEVLRTPTPTDIDISVPARVIATLPVTPDRRHLMPGVDVGVLAPGYAALVAALPPARRPGFVPRALGANPVDARLLETVLDALGKTAWVPAADGEAALVPRRTLIVADLSDELAACLGPVLADLAHPDVSGPAQRAALVAVGAREIGLADIANALADVDRPTQWWAQCYDALAPLVLTAQDAEELGALPVPRADGRRNLGARGLIFAAAGVAAPWAKAVAPDAVHPLLERLGAQPVGPGELLAAPELVVALAEAAEHGTDDEVLDLAHAVLGLLVADPDAELPAAASAELLLPDDEGELVHVDELSMPRSPLVELLGEDCPFALVDDPLIQRYGESALRRAGVGWGFLTVSEQWPTEPNHDLDDEGRWWSGLGEPPSTMTAARDLDLVPDDRWRAALHILADDPATAPLLVEREGYTAWWLREHAQIDGRPVREYRSPDADGFAGIVDPLDHPDAARLSGVLLGDAVRDSPSAAMILAGLGDAQRDVAPGVAVRAYGEVLTALARGDADTEAVMTALGEPPAARTLDGSVCDTGVVVDAAQYLAVVDPARAVVPGLPVAADSAADLAALLDLPLSSEAVPVRVISTGRVTTWEADPDAIAVAAQYSATLPRGRVVVHDDLVVATERGEHRVARWVDEDGTAHLRRMASGR
ncbi:hypothetical protein HUN08_03545 [Gordonia sp. X0973]|uniref:sacsin N-terminal ATP-binding-like domain-containing protein n=1 Tax=Gordonia sp. X0973 TaxID=2742602 RepID=UPI000F539D09|nr:hypothetical protein [Gordonia sp. X0973]QKT06369.1 hypothetical protein HUN08_03545 [Gordonia sp. X0973]